MSPTSSSKVILPSKRGDVPPDPSEEPSEEPPLPSEPPFSPFPESFAAPSKSVIPEPEEEPVEDPPPPWLGLIFLRTFLLFLYASFQAFF